MIPMPSRARKRSSGNGGGGVQSDGVAGPPPCCMSTRRHKNPCTRVLLVWRRLTVIKDKARLILRALQRGVKEIRNACTEQLSRKGRLFFYPFSFSLSLHRILPSRECSGLLSDGRCAGVGRCGETGRAGDGRRGGKGRAGSGRQSISSSA